MKQKTKSPFNFNTRSLSTIRSSWFLLMVSILLGLFYDSTFASELVRVRLQKGLNKVELSGQGLNIGAKPKSFQRVAIPQMQSITVQLENGSKNKWRIKYNHNGESQVLHGDELKISGEMMRVGVEPVPRNLYLFPRKNKSIDVVMVIDIESYLAGVLPSEMPVTWPLEALKAQTVAIRSYTSNLINERKDKHFDLEASIHDQVYRLINQIGSSEENRVKVLRAIRETSGEHLIGRDKKVLKAFYHSDCGGQTEEPSVVWSIPMQIGTAKDGTCPLSPNGLWELEVARNELRDKLTQYFKLGPETVLRGLLVAERSPSGRVRRLDVLFDDQEVKSLTANDFRQLMGYTKLKSANFKFFWNGDSLSIQGRGNGHGVGLCQWGARGLAERGVSYREILKHYYPRAKLVKEELEPPAEFKETRSL